MIQLFLSRSGSSAIVPLQFPASQSAIAEASRQLDEASREGNTKIVEIKSVIANLPSYLPLHRRPGRSQAQRADSPMAGQPSGQHRL